MGFITAFCISLAVGLVPAVFITSTTVMRYGYRFTRKDWIVPVSVYVMFVSASLIGTWLVCLTGAR